MEVNTLDSIRKKVDGLASDAELLPCDQFELFIDGTDSNDQRKQITYTWATADTKKRIVVILIVIVLKLVQWMQREFNARGIRYNLIVWTELTQRE